MAADLLTMLTWSALLIAAVGATAHLYRHMGVLLASQASIMSLAALTDTLLIKYGLNPAASWIVAVCVGCGLGLIHLPILLQTGTSLLLVITALAQLVLVELWYALPQFTGGSGGILLPSNTSSYDAIAILCLLMIGSAGYILFDAAREGRRFDWVCMQAMSTKAGAFGVPTLRLYIIGFVVYGTLLGAAGVAGTRYLGYLTATSFGLPLALATVMIVLSWPSRPILGPLLLSLLYCVIRVILRQSVYASVTIAYLFEVLFPLILLLLLRGRTILASPTVGVSGDLTRKNNHAR